MKTFTRTFIFCAAIFAMINQPGFAHTQSVDDAHCSFIPENDLQIPVGDKNAGGLTETQFNKVIDDVSAFYEPIIAAKGGKLSVARKWGDGTVNASAQRSGKTWKVNMYGGLARHKFASVDGFTLVLCHELGHHLGGFPKSPGLFGDRWASNEGQSDYFATMKCFRRVMANQNNSAVIASMNIPATVKKNCSVQHKSQNEIDLCIRGAMGGYDLAMLLWDLSKKSKDLKDLAETPEPTFETPTTATVTRTDDSHPKAQCRLDTYFAGATCGVAYSEDFGDKDASTGACAEERGDSFSYRPHCWYKPGKRSSL